ncbi:MAG: YkgJ family cysteine cluster protein [Firmicutes bacterium]|nr:YkgJ family cysteine cluster protein [Bacillota bacterium]
MKVLFNPVPIDGKTGLDLEVSDQSATVADLLDAIQPWCADGSIHKQYLEESRGSCEGCLVNCCRECLVVPDIVAFHRLSREFGLDTRGFIDRFIDPEQLRLGLPSLRSSPCVFLRDRICTVYQSRTLICRLYICTPMTSGASDVVYRVIAAGMGGFIRLAREAGLLGAGLAPGSTGYGRLLWDLVQPEAVRPDNPFHRASSYHEVPLQPFLVT